MDNAASIELVIREQLQRSPRVVVALDGRSAAGKSTLAEDLRRSIGGGVLHGDDFYRDLPDPERRRLSPAEGVDKYFDWERMRDEAIRPLRHGDSATFRCFDWRRGGGLTEPVFLEPCALVIVEGVYTARPQLRDFIDLAVLVATSGRERERRRRQRHDPHEWEARWDAAEDVYFSTICPPESFDLITAGTPACLDAQTANTPEGPP